MHHRIQSLSAQDLSRVSTSTLPPICSCYTEGACKPLVTLLHMNETSVAGTSGSDEYPMPHALRSCSRSTPDGGPTRPHSPAHADPYTSALPFVIFSFLERAHTP